MMKGYETKELGGEVATKGTLVCIFDCIIPDIGAWAYGEAVTDEKLIQLLKDHPHFQFKTEEK